MQEGRSLANSQCQQTEWQLNSIRDMAGKWLVVSRFRMWPWQVGLNPIRFLRGSRGAQRTSAQTRVVQMPETSYACYECARVVSLRAGCVSASVSIPPHDLQCCELKGARHTRIMVT